MDSTWSSKIYLSAISSLDEMYTVSEEMIIASADLNFQGQFVMSGSYLPPEDRLYRLHLSKRGDPPATIVIGGKDENHIFLILSKKSQCEIETKKSSSVWGDFTISNCPPNDRLEDIGNILSGFAAELNSGFPRSREYARNALDEELRNFADTSSHPLLSLYALYKTNFEKHRLVDPSFYSQFLERWGDEHSTYYQSFREEIGLKNTTVSSTHQPWYAIIIGVLIGLILWPLYHRIFRSQGVDLHQKYATLSAQERKVFSFLRKGLSNKEISHQMHIELSTVKSHVRNIYSKLEVNTRKEILNLHGLIGNESS